MFHILLKAKMFEIEKERHLYNLKDKSILKKQTFATNEQLKCFPNLLKQPKLHSFLYVV